ncbi:hypothetical protein B0H63DRAFT_519160 [Podospora didyma]|uniref:Uncharacterized protein n=1 Tax=Podospora didyma TaxID=330526 RepID=A0AAE0NY83_9PEZI|nr:hypothetical protein B0H63DRAFT_519160 [Podospora didyma]
MLYNPPRSVASQGRAQAAPEIEAELLSESRRGELAFTHHVKAAIENLDNVLGNFSPGALEESKESEILQQIGKLLGTAQAVKEHEIYLLNGTVGAHGWRSRLDFAVIEISYHDQPWGSQPGLYATQLFKPHLMAGQKKNTTDYDQNDNCWRLDGQVQLVDNLMRKQRWDLDGDDIKLFTVPQEFRLVSVVKHDMKPFTMEVRIRGRLAGSWTNLFRYCAQWVTYQTDWFLIDPTKDYCKQELTEKMGSDIAVGKN